MDSPRPRLPWEVIERAIDHSRGRSKTLRSVALTCRQLLARTRLVMFVHVRFDNRDHVFAFVEFLQENSHLMLIVHSITVWPSDLAPFPLLHILPNLREIKFFHDPNPMGKNVRLRIGQRSISPVSLASRDSERTSRLYTSLVFAS